MTRGARIITLAHVCVSTCACPNGVVTGAKCTATAPVGEAKSSGPITFCCSS